MVEPYSSLRTPCGLIEHQLAPLLTREVVEHVRAPSDDVKKMRVETRQSLMAGLMNEMALKKNGPVTAPAPAPAQAPAAAAATATAASAAPAGGGEGRGGTEDMRR